VLEELQSFDNIKSYNCSSYITKEDDYNAELYLSSLIKKGKIVTIPSGLHNFGCIFSDHGDFWNVYKTSFINSVFQYLNNDVEILKITSWAYMTNQKLQGDRSKLWHNHCSSNNSNRKWISGIYYLKAQADYQYTGTEFSLAENDNNCNSIFLENKERHWNIYPSTMMHRPGIAQGDNYRFVLSADLLYLDS
jgi:hypothetical protein